MIKQNEKSKDIQIKIGKILSIIPVSPNQWTILAVLVALIAGYMIIGGELVYGLILFLLAGALDLVDGAVARARGEVTKFGGFLDGITDRFVEAIFLFSLMFYPLPEIFIDAKIWLAGFVFLGTCMPSFVTAYADHNRVISQEKARKIGGICERTERILLLVMGMGLGLYFSMNYFIYALIVGIILSFLTIIQRIIIVMRG